jgi:hypothetical protein
LFLLKMHYSHLINQLLPGLLTRDEARRIAANTAGAAAESRITKSAFGGVAEVGDDQP